MAPSGKVSQNSSADAGHLSTESTDEQTCPVVVVQAPPASILDGFIRPVQLAIVGAATTVIFKPTLEATVTKITDFATTHEKKIKDTLKKHPHIATSLAVAGGAAILYNVLPDRIASYQKSRVNRKSCSVRISNDSTLYKPFMEFFSRICTYSKLERHVRAKTTKDCKKSDNDWDTVPGSFASDSISYDHEYAYEQKFQHNGKSFWCTKEKDEAVKVWHMGETTTPIHQMLTEIYDATEEKKYAAHIPIYYPCINTEADAAFWEERRPAKSRDLKSVCLEPVMKQSLVQDLDAYFHEASAEWYAERGWPQRRGYMLHGPPGCGKTSLVKAICGQYGLSMYVLALSTAAMTDKILFELFEQIGPKDLILLEDIDAAGAPVESRDTACAGTNNSGKTSSWEDEAFDTNSSSDDTEDEEQSDWIANSSSTEEWNWDNETEAQNNRAESSWEISTPSEKKSKANGKKDKAARAKASVTLSGLLNALDGPNSPEGHVVFMTSNHPEKLDAALTRPGRIDQTIKLNYACREQLRGLFSMFFAPSKARPHTLYNANDVARLAEMFSEIVPEAALTPAQVLEHLFNNMTHPERAVKNAVAWLEGRGLQANTIQHVPNTFSQTVDRKVPGTNSNILEWSSECSDTSLTTDTQSRSQSPVTPEEEELSAPQQQGWLSRMVDSLLLSSPQQELDGFFCY